MHASAPDRRALLGSSLGLAALASACTAPRAARAPQATDELAEIFSDLGDQSSRWKPISAAEKRPRLARAARCLRDAQVDALVVEPGATLSYLSDVGWGRSERLFALVVLADGTSFWIVPAFEARARPAPHRRRRRAAGRARALGRARVRLEAARRRARGAQGRARGGRARGARVRGRAPG
jgi:hypothetical protein